MRFRTEIERPRPGFEIAHSDRIMLLGSCFSDNIGGRLKDGGFDVCINPFGPLYNPATLARFVSALLDNKAYSTDNFYRSADGIYHCLDFAMRYQSDDASALAVTINTQLSRAKCFFDKTDILCLTFGSSETFVLKECNETVGNCHKLSDKLFVRQAMSPEDIVNLWTPLLQRLRSRHIKVIVTVSPIRHLAYGLHGNELGKARLLLALDQLADAVTYFPAYEIMLDDLRDYRFYAADMKHPSEVACDYIYEIFSATFFSNSTLKQTQLSLAAAKASVHRTLLSDI